MPAALGQACNDGPDRRSGNGAHYSVLARDWQPLIAQSRRADEMTCLDRRSAQGTKPATTASWTTPAGTCRGARAALPVLQVLLDLVQTSCELIQLLETHEIY